jgi:hypothetical protein
MLKEDEQNYLRKVGPKYSKIGTTLKPDIRLLQAKRRKELMQASQKFLFVYRRRRVHAGPLHMSTYLRYKRILETVSTLSCCESVMVYLMAVTDEAQLFQPLT